ncbi:MAG: TIGR03086 family metal-binding protein [Actinomycetes bacterium]
MSDTTTLFTQATDAFAAKVHSVAADQWGSPTPCTDWDVRELVNHVVAELLWAGPLVEGQTIAEVGDRFDGDVLGGDPGATTDAAVRAARDAFAAPGALERTVHLSFGDFSGDNYCWQLISDAFVHTWDLARGIGSEDTMDPGLAERVHDFLAPMLAQMSGSPYFAAPVSVGDNASAQEMLLASTGRKP